jgi:flagellin
VISLQGGSLSSIPIYNASLGLKRSMERLSGGLRINRAADDAAGLAISSGLDSQIRGTSQAIANSQDSINLLRTGEGGLGEIQAYLQRLRELLVQANNDTYTAADRAKTQAEVQQIIEGIDNTSLNTEYNGKILLRRLRETYTVTNNYTVNVPGNGEARVSFNIPTSTIRTSITADFSSAFALGNPFPDLNVAFANGVTLGTQALDASAPPPTIPNPAGATGFTDTDPVNGALISGTMTNYSYSGTNVPVESMIFDDPLAGDHELVIDNNSPAVGGAPPITPGGTFNVRVDSYVTVTESNGLQDERSPHAVYFHLGANEGQVIRFELPEASASGLNVLGIDFTRIDNPGVQTRDQVVTDYFNRIDKAMAAVSVARAKFGAMESRLEHNVAGLQLGVENMSASNSRILDTDMAEASSTLVRDQIRMQASTALLAQSGKIRGEMLLGILASARGP